MERTPVDLVESRQSWLEHHGYQQQRKELRIKPLHWQLPK